MTSANLTQTIIDRLQTLPLQKQQQVLATLEDEDLLSNISPAELHALSAIALAQPLQTQLSDLLDRNSENQLSPEDLIQLDRILEQVDQLNLLKARARYTLTISEKRILRESLHSYSIAKSDSAAFQKPLCLLLNLRNLNRNPL